MYIQTKQKGKQMFNFIKIVFILVVLFFTYSYFTYGNGSKTDAQIAADKVVWQETLKVCAIQRNLASMLNDKNWTYGSCLRNKGGRQ